MGTEVKCSSPCRRASKYNEFVTSSDAKLSLQSVTGYFVQLGRCDLPFIYRVDNVRNGRGFCVRHVNVTQQETKGIVFTCICSFKLPDESPVDLQQTMSVRESYRDVLGDVKTWWELEDAPSVLVNR